MYKHVFMCIHTYIHMGLYDSISVNIYIYVNYTYINILNRMLAKIYTYNSMSQDYILRSKIVFFAPPFPLPCQKLHIPQSQSYLQEAN